MTTSKDRNIYEIEEAEKQGLELTKREKRRLKVFRDKRVGLDKIFVNKCRKCGRAIPKPLEYCSSNCRREGIEGKGKGSLLD